MSDFHNELLDDTCWVYVRQNNEGGYIIGVTFDPGFDRREADAGRPLLLWREFDDTLTAAGYRMVLEKLPEESLRKVLSGYRKKCNR